MTANSGDKQQESGLVVQGPGSPELHVARENLPTCVSEEKISASSGPGASRDNKQLAAYCSWRTDRKSHGNAFSLKWSKQLCWLNPPWDLIPQALHKIQQDHATCLACLPIWKTAPWWMKRFACKIAPKCRRSTRLPKIIRLHGRKSSAVVGDIQRGCKIVGWGDLNAFTQFSSQYSLLPTIFLPSYPKHIIPRSS